MKTIAMITVLMWSGFAGATTYYVSSSTGSDSSNGTSAATAWKTLAKVNGQSFQAGDSILLKRGDVWNENLVPGTSGVAGNPIAFDAYGTGAAPNLTGYYSVPTSTWVLVTGNAWKAPVPVGYTTINFCLFGSVWGQKVAASTSNLKGQWDFYFANGYVYVYSVGNPGTYYGTPIVPMALSNVPVISVNGKSWLTFQHLLVNWFDEYGVYVQGASDHLVFANMEMDSMIPQGTQPLGFYVSESAPGPGDLKIYNSEAHMNYDGFRFDGTATAITMVNDKAYGNRNGALVDNTGSVTYSYCHFYGSSLAIASSTDVLWTSGDGPTAGSGNIAQDSAPAVQAWQRYPAEVTLTLDDAGMTAGAESYYESTVLPIADAAGVPVGVAITVGYPLAQTLVSEFQEWLDAGRDVTSHSMSHTYYTNTDALDIQYTGSGSAATMSIANKTLTITVTGAPDGGSYNLAQGQAQGTIQQLRAALQATGKFTVTEPTPCQGPYGTGCSAYTEAGLLAQDLADVSAQDVKGSVYHMQLDVTRLTTDELTLSRQWMTSHLTGLPATAVYVYPGGYETPTMQGLAASVPYDGARGALKEDLGVKDTYASGFDVQNVTSFGVSPSWQGQPPSALNQKVQTLVWKEMVWGVPWGIFWHSNELTSTEITNLIADLQSNGATIQTNTGLVNWLTSGTLEPGMDGNFYYKSAASSMALDFRPRTSSPVVDAGQNLGVAYQIDINGLNQNSYGSGWEIGAHAYAAYSSYGQGNAPAGSHFAIGGEPADLTQSNCGPPTYSCVSTSTADPGPIAPIFTSTAPTATTCAGDCQNATAYDTTLNPEGIDCITRITDGTTFPSGLSAGNVTFSGGDNDIMGSVNETYVGVNTGQVYILHMNNSGNCTQVVNAGVVPGIHVAGPFGFSSLVDTRFYYLVNKTQLYQGDITSDTTYTPTMLVDIKAAGVCPGADWSTFGTPTTASIMGISLDDSRFGWSVGPSTQGSADWEFVWDRTRGCSSVNYATGQYWDFCKSGSCGPNTPSTGTLALGGTSCWGSQGASMHGIHDSQMSSDGKYMFTQLQITGTSNVPWTAGACAGSTLSNQQVIYEIGTGNTQWAYSNPTSGVGGAQSGSHASAGISRYVTPYFNGPNIRSFSDVSTYSTFAPPVVTTDVHGTWPHPTGDDTYPWINASDLVTTADGGVLSPHYLQDVVFAWYPTTAYPPGQLPSVFAHTFSCGDNAHDHSCAGGADHVFGAQQSIGFATQKGNFFCWASTHLQNLGNDNLGYPRQDAFCVRLGSLSASPAGPEMFGFTETSTSAGNFPTVDYGMQRYWDSPPLQWPSLNTAPNTFSSANFSALDTLLAQDYTNGIMETMYTLSRTPTWASSNQTDPDPVCSYNGTGPGQGVGQCYPPSDLSTDGSGTNAIYKAWVTKIAQHANGQDGNPAFLTNHAHIKYWEPVNEADSPNMWHGSIAQLARMVEDANCIITGRGVIHQNGDGTATPCTAIAIDSAATIIMPSAHATSASVLLYGQNELYCNNTAGIPAYELPCPNPPNAIANAVDILNYHLKPGNTLGNNCPSGTPCTVETAMAFYMTNIRAYLQPAELAKPFWNGEMSYAVAGFTNAYADPDMAASFFPRMYLTQWSLGISGSEFYTWDSMKSQSPQVQAAYQQTYSWLSDAILSAPCAASGTVYSCHLVKSGQAYLVMWDSAQSCSAGTCSTANQPVASQWKNFQDMTSASTPAPIPGQGVAVGIKPVVLSQ